jgi:hypothetical protein
VVEGVGASVISRIRVNPPTLSSAVAITFDLRFLAKQ